MFTKNLTDYKSKKIDLTLWFVAVGLLLFGFVGYYSFLSQSLLLKVVGSLVILILALGVASLTNIGKVAIRYCQESLVELQKVVWPTKKETVQTTIVVLVMIATMGIFLWLVDLILLKLVAKILY